MNKRSLCLALVLAATSCTGNGPPGDPACSVANCELLLVDCHSILPGATDSTCLDLIVDQDAMAEWVDAGHQFCVDACNADQQGAVLTCVAREFPGNSCLELELDGGDATEAITTACVPAAGACGANCQSCQQQCVQTQRACNQGCSDGGVWSACLSCNFDCNQQLVQCEGACPVD